MFVQGVIFGVLLIILIEALLLYQFILILTKSRLLPVSDGEPKQQSKAEIEFPASIADRIKDWLRVGNQDMESMSPTTEAEWLNLVLHRFFLVLRCSLVFRKKWAVQVGEKLNQKLVGNSFLSRVDITDLDLGENAPRLTGIRLSKGLTQDLAVSGEADLIYRGGASIKVNVVLSNQTMIPIQIFMSEFSGTVRVRLPSEKSPDRFSVCFVRDPGVTFKVETPLTVQNNETLRSIVNRVLSQITRRVFLDLWVLPSMRTFYLPFLEPKHVEKELVFEKQETKPITNVIDRANRFFTTSKEVLGDPIPQVFDLNLVVNPADQSLKQYKLQLVEAFMDFYNEPIRQEENEIPDALYGKWKETKLKYGIQAFKKKIQIGQSPAELYQTRTQIQCDSTRVVGVLSNPKHLHHMYDTIESDKILSDDPLVVRLEMNLQKQQKSITFMEAKQTIDNATIIVMRSVATVHEEPKENGIDIKRKSLASPPNSFGKSNQIKECPVYIYGYHVKPHLEDPNQCFVTCISCFNHELKPLETDIQPMRKLKAFIEELANITDNSVKKKNEQDSLDKLKNYVGMAQQFFKQKTQFKSTESVEQEDLDKSSEKVSEKSFEKVSQSVSEKLVEKVSQHVSETLVERTAEKLVEKTAESVVETAAVGAVEKTAEKPLIVEELVDKVEIEAEEPQSMAESDTTQEFTIIQPNKDQEKSEKEMMDSLHSLDHAYFVDEPYIERIIGSREICSVAIPYNGQGTQFSFEFMSRMEHLPMFGLHFHPDQKTTLLPMEEGHCVLFPMATVQAYTRPAHCTFPLDNLPHGTFYLIWDNQSIMSKNREKQITYKAMIRHTPKSIWSISVTISRKSYYKLPILVSGKSKLDTDFESQGIEIPFSMSFSPINTNLVTVLCPKKRMCHLIGSGFESIDVTGLVGTITLEWDNTQSLISSRQVTFNIKLQ